MVEELIFLWKNILEETSMAMGSRETLFILLYTTVSAYN